MTLNLTIDDLVLYSQCPNKWNYSKKDKENKLTADQLITVDLLKKAPLMELSLLPHRSLTTQVAGWASAEVYRSMPNLDTQSEWDVADDLTKKVSNYTYSFIDKALTTINPSFSAPGPSVKWRVPDTTHEINILQDFDLIFLSKKDLITIVKFTNDFSTFDLKSYTPYNDLRYQILMYIISDYFEMNQSDDRIRLMVCSFSDNVVGYRHMNDYKLNLKTKTIIQQLSYGILNKVYWPVRSEQCDSCLYKSICKY